MASRRFDEVNLLLLSMTSALNAAGAVALAVLILLAMITVHEFGHYVAGKALGFKINEFAIGFGPALIKVKGRRTGEVFSVRAVPLGGYCAFEGENDERGLLSEGGFASKPPWQRMVVLVSGALFNYAAAVALIIVSFAAFGQTVIKIGGVTYPEGYDAANSFIAGDVVLEAEGEGVYLTSDLMEALEGRLAGERAYFTVVRGGEVCEIGVALRRDCVFGSIADTSVLWSALGIGTELREDGERYWQVGADSYRFPPSECVGRAFAYSFRIAGTIFRALGELLTGSMGLDAMGGPVTTIKLTSQLASQGVQSFLEIAAYIGVNLAVFNLLPIPALDGSKVLFCVIEQVRGRPVPPRVEAAVHAAGFVFLLAFAVVADIVQFSRC